MINETIKRIVRNVLREYIEGNTPDYLKCNGDTYIVLEDGSITLLYHKGKWLRNAETHRDIISLTKFGCEEWKLSEYYSYDKCRIIRGMLDELWSSGKEFKYPSRIYYAKGNAKANGVNYILASWDKLDENIIQSICNSLHIDRKELVYVK